MRYDVYDSKTLIPRRRGDAMQTINKPSKEAIRTWLGSTIATRRPPPSPERIREMLGWSLLTAERKPVATR
jgi:hypothetical protein